MQAVTFEHAQSLVHRLGLFDQIQLLEYLSSLIARAAKTDKKIFVEDPAKTVEGDNSAWDDLFAIGDTLMNVPATQSESLTSTLLSMRR